MNKAKVIATLIQLDRSDVSELEVISSQYSELLSDMERLEAITDDVDDEATDQRVTMCVPRQTKD